MGRRRHPSRTLPKILGFLWSPYLRVGNAMHIAAPHPGQGLVMNIHLTDVGPNALHFTERRGEEARSRQWGGFVTKMSARGKSGTMTALVNARHHPNILGPSGVSLNLLFPRPGGSVRRAVLKRPTFPKGQQ